ncbi:hypothetical protein PF004_g4682 [Phytophthora fragariae]|uniref:Uncharacterized protein n=1 Tax=Phytophthora fragariae TaxID=53985 RepID=A0A6A3FGH4_9STRA|nr:hypothetical protein PF009_g5523 [Phytophthora fragariae]KAE9246672.1 hypothetical protein PF004_g4682 [Phytophthora fragariae]
MSKSGSEAGVGGIGFRDGGAGGTPLPRQQATGPRLRDTCLNQAPLVAQLERYVIVALVDQLRDVGREHRTQPVYSHVPSIFSGLVKPFK